MCCGSHWPPLTCRSDRAFDRPIDRPKSAAGAVGRPRSATQDSLLPNGMPVLPNDLSLEGLAGEGNSKGTQNSASITFGFQPSQGPSGLAPGEPLCDHLQTKLAPTRSMSV